jgi:hypothetical protein
MAMRRSRALYRDVTLEPVPRAHLALGSSELSMQMPDGQHRCVVLDGATIGVSDASFRRRFVRMLTVERPGERCAIITPPDHGAIAPRAVPLPQAPDDAAVVEDGPWEAVVGWLTSGGRLAGRTVAELASLALVATPQFAIAIGEVAAQVALEMIWEQAGPLRGGADLDHSLYPLYDAARRSPRASDALVAAMAVCAARRARRRLR